MWFSAPGEFCIPVAGSVLTRLKRNIAVLVSGEGGRDGEEYKNNNFEGK